MHRTENKTFIIILPYSFHSNWSIFMYHILYVDDEPALLELGKIFLEDSKKFIVDTVTSATEALEVQSHILFDAIISDYQMAGMDGLLYLKNVRSRYGDIPFILFTGKGREEVVINAINSGVDFYLQKIYLDILLVIL